MEYRLIRSSRKSISVEISPLGEVTVRAGMLCTKKDIDRFVSDHADWIERNREKTLKTADRFEDVIRFKAALVDGVRVPLIFSDKNLLDRDALYVTDVRMVPYAVYNARRAAFLGRCGAISKKTGLCPNSVTFKEYKTRWGCCDCRDDVTFNVCLLFLPFRLQEYVITHEFCHIKVKNHSYDFKALLSSVCPDWERAREEIKEYSFLPGLYAQPVR